LVLQVSSKNKSALTLSCCAMHGMDYPSAKGGTAVSTKEERLPVVTGSLHARLRQLR
jgi:hypothetical protein